MHGKQIGIARTGIAILLLIAAAVVILFLLPTPKPDAAVAAAPAQPATDANCLAVPKGFSQPAVIASVAPATIWKGWRYGSDIAVAATPQSALMDQAVTVRVSGLQPGEPVTLRASTVDYKKRDWSAQATFMADRNGVVDASRDAPKYGSYAGVHAMGLIWSMLPDGGKGADAAFYAPPSDAFPIHLQAVANGRALADITLTRNLSAPGVKKIDLDTDGLVGELYTPATPGPHPAVIVLGGSEGGLYPQVNEAALLASHGYVALGLAYFQGFQSGDPALSRLPKLLQDIPLEYFITAAAWLKKQPGVDARHVAIMGWSKGAEAALITAAEFPKAFQAMIAFMPSSLVWTGINYGAGPASSSWTLHGKPLPWADLAFNPAMFASGKPVALVVGYRDGLKNAKAVAKAAIPVENIAAPVLLVSATDDQIWPSSLMARQIMQRLAAHHHAYPDQSLCYAGAGHAILPPWRPTDPGGAMGSSEVRIAFGGHPVAYAFADRDAWQHVLAFLQASLAPGKGRAAQ